MFSQLRRYIACATTRKSRRKTASIAADNAEALELRQLLAADVTFTVQGNNLVLNGSANADCVEVRNIGNQVFVNAQATGLPANQLKKLTFDSEGNDDAFEAIGISAKLKLTGGPGNDILIGDEGKDTILPGSGSDYVDAGDGNDVVKGGNGDDIIRGGVGADKLKGGEGGDIFVIKGDSVDGAFGAGSDLQFNSKGKLLIDKISDFDDAEDVLVLQDMRVTGVGTVTYQRNKGRVLLFDSANSSGPWVIAKLPKKLNLRVVNQGDGNWSLVGNTSFTDTDTSNTTANTVTQGARDITFDGSDNDIIQTGNGDDVVNGGGDDDFIDGENGNDIVHGGGDDDVLRGSRGADILIGGAGSDVFRIIGDPVDGAYGADSDLQFDSAGDLITDLILDFNDSEDILVLQDLQVVGIGSVTYDSDTGEVTLTDTVTTFSRKIATLSPGLDIAVIDQGDGNWTLL